MGEEKRIIDLTDKSSLTDTDYSVLHNASESEAKKFSLLNLWNYIKGKIGISSSGSTFLRKDGTWATADGTDSTARGWIRSTSSFPTGDAYSSSSAYSVGDLVIYSNTLYRCKTACSAGSWSTNSSNFESVTLAKAITKVNSDLNKNYQFNSNPIDVSSYKTSSNLFTAPSDGHVYINAVGSAALHILSNGQEVITQIQNPNASGAIYMSEFIKKGLKLYIATASSTLIARFVKLE